MANANYCEGYDSHKKLIMALLNASKTANLFIKKVLELRLPHLSYSSVCSIEFCERRYYYEYVKMQRLRPTPEYFVKGSIFHDIAARYYTYRSTRRKLVPKYLTKRIESTDGIRHINNATKLLIKHAWKDWCVIGAEIPFVLDISNDLPPFIGVIDLLLQKNKSYAIVDHKTGRNFNELDPLQLVFYNEYVKKTFRPEKCVAYFDEYRWVNNLERIRKPAFRRTPVKFLRSTYNKALKRVKIAFVKMAKITSIADTAESNNCWICPYHYICNI